MEKIDNRERCVRLSSPYVPAKTLVALTDKLRPRRTHGQTDISALLLLVATFFRPTFPSKNSAIKSTWIRGLGGADGGGWGERVYVSSAAGSEGWRGVTGGGEDGGTPARCTPSNGSSAGIPG